MIDITQALSRRKTRNSQVENIGGDNVLQVSEELNPFGINDVKKTYLVYHLEKSLNSSH